MMPPLRDARPLFVMGDIHGHYDRMVASARAQLDPAAVERAVKDAVAETGATSPKDLGRVMKAAMARLAGQDVDGKVVNELARKMLGGG